jgi:CBS domain-containing protein
MNALRGGEMFVKEIMTKDLRVATPEMGLVAVARLMKECDCGAIPVVRSESDEEPVGIITDRDIAIRAVAESADIIEAKVEDYMTESAVTIEADETVEDCVKKMEEEKIRRIVVVDENGKCIGIITQAQIALNVPGQVTGELLQEISR